MRIFARVFIYVYIHLVHWIYTDSNTKIYLKMQFTTYARLSKKIEMAGRVAHMGDRRRVYRVLMARPEGKRPLGRPRNRWKDNIKIYSQEMGWAPVLS